MKKFVKLSICLLSLLLIGSITHIQANCDHYDVASSQTVGLHYQSEQRYPQTIIHELVSSFLIDNQDNKNKKVLLLGFDGYREDALVNIIDQQHSAVKEIMNTGGLYHSYAGADGNQETSTAPGWLSILSGEWAYQYGVTNNNGRKDSDTATFLSDAVALGYSSTFVASWSSHFNVTYQDDIYYPYGQAVYQQKADDSDTITTLHELLADTSDSSYDVIFTTLEFTDHAGHTIGYGNHVEEYSEASKQVDQYGYELLRTIRERTTYYEEDWLIIITTDHGGKANIHGGQSDEEKNTWFAVNKDVSKYLENAK